MTVLDTHLSPWINTPFPGRTDFGIDGDVKVASPEMGCLTVRVLPLTFQYQLKSQEAREGRVSVRIKIRHLKFWLGHNVPTFLFVAPVVRRRRTGRVYWKCIDSAFERQLSHRNPKWRSKQTLSLTFDYSERFTERTRPAFLSVVESWHQRDRHPRSRSTR